MGPLGRRATVDGMELIEHIGALVIVGGAAVLFALMAWAGQHQS